MMITLFDMIVGFVDTDEEPLTAEQEKLIRSHPIAVLWGTSDPVFPPVPPPTVH